MIAAKCIDLTGLWSACATQITICWIWLHGSDAQPCTHQGTHQLPDILQRVQTNFEDLGLCSNDAPPAQAEQQCASDSLHAPTPHGANCHPWLSYSLQPQSRSLPYIICTGLLLGQGQF